MTLGDALAQKPVQFQTLDNRTINLNLDIAISPQTVHKIAGEGMPLENISSGDASADLECKLKSPS